MVVRYIWFWSFWHWSRESHRAGMLLKRPLEGLAVHWDEWYRHEASARERDEIERLRDSAAEQQAFLDWLEQTWSREAVAHHSAALAAYVWRELRRVEPFVDWPAVVAVRAADDERGIAAVILAEVSAGTADDVVPIDAILLPGEIETDEGAVVAENFEAEPGDLENSRQAVLGLLRGRQRWSVAWRWLLLGQRDYRRGLAFTLLAGWGAVALGLAWLLVGPDPGEQLPWLAGGLVSVWCGLVLVALITHGRELRRFFRAGRRMATGFAAAQVRLRLPARFKLKGGSAGLAFGLSSLRAMRRAWPELSERSWLWRRSLERLDADAAAWAATGILTSEGAVRPVEVAAKLQACRQHGQITHLLMPTQTTVAPLGGEAGGGGRLQLHRCSNLADALLHVAALRSPAQTVINVATLGLSALMIFGLPDLVRILVPPAPPPVVAPSSPTPYALWVSLDTASPEFFQVVLESRVWAYRRADVRLHNSAPASVRAELRLLKRSDAATRDLEDGIVWIERRPCFLFRRFEPGERVGRYTVSYLNRLRHE